MNSKQQKDYLSKTQPLPDKAIKVLANSIFKTLKSEGCENKDIIGVSSQLIGLVTSAWDDNNLKIKR